MLSFESPVHTPWHGLPVAGKFIFLCIVSLVLFKVGSVALQFLALILVICLYLVAGPQFLLVGLKRMVFLWPFLVVIALWHSYSNTVNDGLVIAFRLLAIVGLSNLVTTTSRLSDILDMMRSALTPLRYLGVQTRPVELAIALLVRFTPVLIDKGSALKEAWRARSNSRSLWRLVFPLSLAAIDEAEQVAEALRARGGIRPQDRYTGGRETKL